MPSFLGRLVLFAAIAGSVSAQDAVGDLAEPAGIPGSTLAVGDTTRAEVVRPDSSQADSAATPLLGGILRQVAATARQQADLAPPESSALVRAALDRAASPTQHVFGSGVTAILPPGWNGPTAIDEQPGYALYSFVNASAGHALNGATLHIERVDNLDPLMQEQWQRGQTARGYHGTRPVGPISAPTTGLALEVADGSRGGAVVFSRDRNVGWAIQVVAPTAVWQARRGELIALLAAVDLP